MIPALLLSSVFVSVLKGLMMFFFILSAILLMVIVLLQEPKGGGLSSAFGGAGAETFGVQTGGVNKFTAWVAGIFMALAILYAAIPEGGGALSDESLRDTTNVEKTTTEGAPAKTPGQPAQPPAGPENG